MKICSRWELSGDVIGKLLDISFVGDDHFFGISEDGTEIHIPGSDMGIVPVSGE